MGTVISLLFASGVLCLWWSLWEVPPRPPRQRRLHSRFRDRLNQAGMYALGPLAFTFVCLAVGAVAWLVTLALTTSFAIAGAMGVLFGTSPLWYVSIAARKRRTERSSLWPEAVDDLVSAIRAGMSLPEALIALSERGPEELREHFHQFAADYRATGRFIDSLDQLKYRLADPVADRIIEALRLTRDVGGTELTTLLQTLGDFLREDSRTRSELLARQSWTVNGARLATAAPWFVLALLATRRETAQAFDTPLGVFVLLVGAVLTVLAYVLMVRFGRLPEEARVLR